MSQASFRPVWVWTENLRYVDWHHVVLGEALCSFWFYSKESASSRPALGQSGCGLRTCSPWTGTTVCLVGHCAGFRLIVEGHPLPGQLRGGLGVDREPAVRGLASRCAG